MVCGGIGSRFWLMSRNNFPKQFIDILGSGKNTHPSNLWAIFSICPSENIFIVKMNNIWNMYEQIPDYQNQVLSEPQRRNTGPCVAYAAYKSPNWIRVGKHGDCSIWSCDKRRLKFPWSTKRAWLLQPRMNVYFYNWYSSEQADTGCGYIQFQEDDREEKFKIQKVKKTFTENRILKWPNFLKARLFMNVGILCGTSIPSRKLLKNISWIWRPYSRKEKRIIIRLLKEISFVVHIHCTK